jgi:hypothetical protein
LVYVVAAVALLIPKKSRQQASMVRSIGFFM